MGLLVKLSFEFLLLSLSFLLALLTALAKAILKFIVLLLLPRLHSLVNVLNVLAIVS